MTEQKIHNKNLVASPTTIHDRLEILRNRYAMDSSEFGKLLKISKQRYRDSINNHRNFQLDLLINLATAKPNLNFNWLIRGVGPIEQNKYVQEETFTIAAEPGYSSVERELKVCQDRNALLEELLAVYRNAAK